MLCNLAYPTPTPFLEQFHVMVFSSFLPSHLTPTKPWFFPSPPLSLLWFSSPLTHLAGLTCTLAVRPLGRGDHLTHLVHGLRWVTLSCEVHYTRTSLAFVASAHIRVTNAPAPVW